jgi:hypothetical protein
MEKQQVSSYDVMTEEYQSIMKNYVSIRSNMQLMEVSRNTKRDLWPEDSLRWRE